MNTVESQHGEIVEIQEQGVVTASQGAWHTVETRSGNFVAKKAVSCLIEPIEDDTVLVAGNEDDGLYVLAVLERPGRQDATIRLDTGLRLTLEKGRLSLAAEEGISLASPGDIGLTSTEMTVHTSKGQVTAGTLFFSGSFWTGQVDRLRMLAAHVETCIQSLTQQIQRCYRRVEGTDCLRAGRLDYLVDKLLSLRGKHSMITAREDVKIDGERIHMG